MAVKDTNTRVTISISKELKAKLENLATQDDRSLSNYINAVLRGHVYLLENNCELVYETNQKQISLFFAKTLAKSGYYYVTAMTRYYG